MKLKNNDINKLKNKYNCLPKNNNHNDIYNNFQPINFKYFLLYK